jgi:hypothetical protein
MDYSNSIDSLYDCSKAQRRNNVSELWAPRDTYVTEDNLSAVILDARFAGGIAASSQSEGYGGQLFSRDALRVMHDTMNRYPQMTRELFSIIPQMQGTELNESTNEFPDSLPHQTFRQFVSGRRLPDRQVEEAELWTGKWGVEMQFSEEEGKHFSVYNSSDAPLLYLITLSEFCELPESQGVLRDEYFHRPTGETRNVGEAARRCIDFILQRIKESETRGSGLYVVPNTNPLQTSPSGVMRDGFDSYYHPVGEYGQPADFGFMAYVENQALAFDALRAAAKMFPDDEDAPLWLNTAAQLQKRGLEAFWMPESGLFAAAIDSDGTQVKLKSTAMAELLNSDFLKVPEGPSYVRAIVKWLYSKDVMTAAGPRMLSREHAAYEGDYYPYQGTGAVWPYVNGVIAEGLRDHWDLPSLSYDVSVMRTLGSLEQAGSALELLYIHKETGEAIYRPSIAASIGTTAIAAELGNNHQTWTASMGLRELRAWRESPRREQAGTWQRALARQVMMMAVDTPPATANRHYGQYYADAAWANKLKAARARRLDLAA